MLCSIYKITNLVNNKIYIGQTWNTIKQRWFDHKKPSGKKCIKLHRAIMKYNATSFSRELLTLCSTQEMADYWEDFLLKNIIVLLLTTILDPAGHEENYRKNRNEI